MLNGTYGSSRGSGCGFQHPHQVAHKLFVTPDTGVLIPSLTSIGIHTNMVRHPHEHTKRTHTYTQIEILNYFKTLKYTK